MIHFVNAGRQVAPCGANQGQKLRARLVLTEDTQKVSCGKCLQYLRKRAAAAQADADALRSCTGSVAVTLTDGPITVTSTALTVAQRRQRLTAAGIIIRKTDEGEYRVNYRGASERYAAYESDMLAAVETGEAMNRQRPEVIKADIRVKTGEQR